MRQPGENLEQYDRYIAALFAPEDEALRDALAEMDREHIPSIQVAATQGKLLSLLVAMTGARRILEVGTLGGYSAIWMARALPPDGKLVSLELETHHADVARRNIARGGLSGRVEVRVGPAAQTLADMAATGEPPFDLAFIDADKGGYVDYLRLAYPLVREGGLILADNTLPDAILEGAEETGTMRYNAAVAAHPGLISVIIPAIKRGVDGLTVSLKKSGA